MYRETRKIDGTRSTTCTPGIRGQSGLKEEGEDINGSTIDLVGRVILDVLKEIIN